MAVVAEDSTIATNGRKTSPWTGAATLRSIAPATAFYAAFFFVPMLALLVLSFWEAKANLIPTFTLANYGKIATSALYHTLILRTDDRRAQHGVIVVPIAFVLSYLMRFVFERRGQLILQLVLLSLFSGYLVRIYAWRTILGQAGPAQQRAPVPRHHRPAARPS